MNIAKRIAILFGPLVVIVILAFVLLDDDPAHNHRDYVVGQWVGFGYVAYAAVLAFRWSKANKSRLAREHHVRLHTTCIAASDVLCSATR